MQDISYGKELGRIYEEKGVLLPSVVVEEASDPASPLHSAFEWDDEKAGHAHRLLQARQLIKTVKIVYTEGGRTQRFYNVKIHAVDERSQEELDARGYMGEDKVRSDPYFLNQVKKDALQQLKYWQNKYAHISELSLLINESMLKEVEQKVNFTERIKPPSFVTN